MKIVAVMSMRNEADIIESWVRYYSRMVDQLIITDNMSIDGSGDLVKKLITEGLPISLETDHRLGHLQPERMQKMMHHAFTELKADWVLLLDADEFLIPPTDKTFYDIFSGLKNDRPLKVPWKTYIPTDSDTDDPNALKRITHRLENESIQYYKMMVPAGVGVNPDVVIGMGNHKTLMGGGKVKWQDAPQGVFLAHFPVRSMQQIKTKVMVGWLATLIRPNHKKRHNYHWKLMFDTFIQNNGESLDDLQNIAVNYLGMAKNSHNLPQIITHSIDKGLSNFTIRYASESQCRPFTMFAKTAEDIALHCGHIAAQLEAMKPDPVKTHQNILSPIKGYIFKKKNSG